MVEEVRHHAFLIAQVTHFGYQDIMQMPDDERLWWYEKCEEYADSVNSSASKADSGVDLFGS